MKLSVVKIGGNVIDNPIALKDFIQKFANIPSPKILIHGGGKIATEITTKLGFPTQMIDGRRITDKHTLEVVCMVYGGLINKSIVAQLQAAGCNAIGLSGADANIIPAQRRSATPIDYGYVGDINASEVNTEIISTLLNAGLTPVFCALTHDQQGSMLNSNADSIASAIAVSMAAKTEVNLIFCFELAGVMEDITRPDSVIPLLDERSYQHLRSTGIVGKGMIPKIENAFAALKKGVKRVIITHADKVDQPSGTTIQL